MLRRRGGRVVAWRDDEVWNDRNEDGDDGGRQMLRVIHYTSLALRKENDRCLQGCSLKG
jgi:hypothetical protein